MLRSKKMKKAEIHLIHFSSEYIIGANERLGLLISQLRAEKRWFFSYNGIFPSKMNSKYSDCDSVSSVAVPEIVSGDFSNMTETFRPCIK